jgi:hypothetical protein
MIAINFDGEQYSRLQKLLDLGPHESPTASAIISKLEQQDAELSLCGDLQGGDTALVDDATRRAKAAAKLTY